MSSCKFKFQFAVVFLLLCCTSNAHRILGLFPHPGVSHFHFFHPVMKALAEAGHDVTVVSQFPNKNPIENYRDEPIKSQHNLSNFVNLDWFANPKPYDHLLEFFMLHQWGVEACDRTLNSSAIKNVLNQGRREPFDLVIVEQFNTDCMLGIAHKLKAPVVGLSSSNIMPWHYTRYGLPYEPGLITTTFNTGSDHMSFSKRISNWFTLVYMNVMYRIFVERDANALLKKRFGDDIPDLDVLTKKVSMMFVNQHYALSGPKHLSPNIVELGGIHIEKPRPLDPELQDLLDTAEHGVIYISYGSMVRAETMPEEKREAILHSVGKLKQRVLWKYENDTIPNAPPNVFIRKWMPQRDILCHPNVRLFMTHGGLLGSSEAAFCGVPVVSTPFYGDQFMNSAAMEKRGMAVILKYQDMNRDSVFQALRKGLDSKMRENARKVAYSYTHRPMKPKEAAVYWAEYVIATGGAALTRPHAVDAHWLVYSGLDIYLFVTAVIFLAVYCWIYVWRKIFSKAIEEPKRASSYRGASIDRKTR